MANIPDHILRDLSNKMKEDQIAACKRVALLMIAFDISLEEAVNSCAIWTAQFGIEGMITTMGLAKTRWAVNSILDKFERDIKFKGESNG